MASRNYRDLIAWQKAMDLTVAVYRSTQSYPSSEMYGLVSQSRRAAVSVPANIAEGEGRGTKPEFARFLRIAHGSLRELETHLMLAARLSYIAERAASETLDQCSEVGRLISGLIRASDVRM
jgi:four helix bundle protein